MMPPMRHRALVILLLFLGIGSGCAALEKLDVLGKVDRMTANTTSMARDTFLMEQHTAPLESVRPLLEAVDTEGLARELPETLDQVQAALEPITARLDSILTSLDQILKRTVEILPPEGESLTAVVGDSPGTLDAVKTLIGDNQTGVQALVNQTQVLIVRMDAILSQQEDALTDLVTQADSLTRRLDSILEKREPELSRLVKELTRAAEATHKVMGDDGATAYALLVELQAVASDLHRILEPHAEAGTSYSELPERVSRLVGNEEEGLVRLVDSANRTFASGTSYTSPFFLALAALVVLAAANLILNLLVLIGRLRSPPRSGA